MENQFEKPYQPSLEETTKAEEMMTGDQKEASEERVKSLEQKEQLPPVLVVYRYNDSFKEQILEMVKDLSAMGRKVEIQKFPFNTNKEEIENWYMQHKNDISGKEIISDWTASIPFSMREELISKGVQESGKLDELINEAARRTVLGEKYRELDISKNREEWTIEKSAEFFSAIIKHILKNPNNIPDNVVLLEDHILDHLPFDKKELINELGIKGEDFNNRSIDQNERMERLASEKLKGWLNNGGLNIDRGHFVVQRYRAQIGGGESHVDKSLIGFADNPNYWVIADRHTGLSQNDFNAARFLYLPEGDFYKTAMDAGLIDIKPEESVENLKKVLEEKFAKKYEEPTIESGA